MGKNIESIMMNVPSLCSSLELLELFGTIESVHSPFGATR